jgi:hypothetical protein
MASVRMAAGNMLSTVADTANAVSGVMNTVSGGVSILNDMVQNVKNKRREATLVEMISFRDNLINDASIDAVKREENILSYIGNDVNKQKSFEDFHTKLENAFKAYDNKNIQDQE